ncbi:hypothetical protein GE061_000245 [Apolygus lucorum]|uniref:legumain n=1 Tax=Apolygus lucorum TaxID=248454 RepID=A0A6A4KD64_APOLU|nr:hypothetical protein GE061_000245 [Apolygus lucorum]
MQSHTLRIWSAAILLGSISATPTTPLGKDSWALLVAGSNSYMNYRHQADVCHSYHVMIAEGIPAERIIVMMYDDIAYSALNPFPGTIINRPGGPNVYKGVKIDYRGTDVTPTNFLRVLKGDKQAMQGIGSGRVIESDRDTNIFVYFSDHGGYQVLAFPTGFLLASSLTNTLIEMYRSNRYNKIIMYIEACFAGSLFDGILPNNMRVFAMTASARNENSYPLFWDYSYRAHLADVFSFFWLDRMDSTRNGTFDQFFNQFQVLRLQVPTSHVEIYGDFSIGFDAMTPNHAAPTTPSWPDQNLYSVVDVPVFHHERMIDAARDLRSKQAAQQEYDLLVQGRKVFDELMEEIAKVATEGTGHTSSEVLVPFPPATPEISPCYESLIDTFARHCFAHEHHYILKHLRVFANICIMKLDAAKLEARMPSLCAPYADRVMTVVL